MKQLTLSIFLQKHPHIKSRFANTKSLFSSTPPLSSSTSNDENAHACITFLHFRIAERFRHSTDFSRMLASPTLAFDPWVVHDHSKRPPVLSTSHGQAMPPCGPANSWKLDDQPPTFGRSARRHGWPMRGAEYRRTLAMVMNYPCVEDERRGGKHGREISRMPAPHIDLKVRESDTGARIFVLVFH